MVPWDEWDEKWSEFQIGDLVKILYDPLEGDLGVVVGEPFYEVGDDLIQIPVYCQNGRTVSFVNEDLLKVSK